MNYFILVIFTVISVHFTTACQTQEGEWVSDDSPFIKFPSNDVIVWEASDLNSTKSRSAIWVDGNGITGTQKEHYWTIQFSSVRMREFDISVGLSTKELFQNGAGSRGLLYNGNLWNGVENLVQNYGPGISHHTKIGILTSLDSHQNSSILKVYLFQNDAPLGLAFQVPLATILNAHPALRFSDSSKGSAKICRESRIPENRHRGPKLILDIQGSWRVVPNTVKLNGNQVRQGKKFDPHGVTLEFTRDTGKLWRGHLKVMNHFFFDIERTDKAWIQVNDTASWSSTGIFLTGNENDYEGEVWQLMRNPTEVKLAGNGMIIVKGNSTATFTRQDDTPKPFVGDAFKMAA